MLIATASTHLVFRRGGRTRVILWSGVPLLERCASTRVCLYSVVPVVQEGVGQEGCVCGGKGVGVGTHSSRRTPSTPF